MAIAMTAPLTILAAAAEHERTTTSSYQSHSETKASSDIIGMDVKAANGETFAKVGDICIDMESGKVIAIVIAAKPDGLLGKSGPSYLLSTEDLRFDDEKKHLLTSLSEQQLLSAPRHRQLDSSAISKVRPLGSSTPAGSQRSATTHATATHQPSPRAVMMAATDLIGMSIENHAGEKVGTVDEIYIDIEGGYVIGAVVATGGFLGIGAHQNVLALNELQYNADKDTIRVNLDQEQLRLAPTYKKNDSSWNAVVLERSHRNTESLTADTKTRGKAVAATYTDAKTTPVYSQGSSTKETEMTADIRKAILSDDTMSRRANNVTIITQNNQVFLRGNVDSLTEKTAIENIAGNKAGNRNVTSELVVVAR